MRTTTALILAALLPLLASCEWLEGLMEEPEPFDYLIVATDALYVTGASHAGYRTETGFDTKVIPLNELVGTSYDAEELLAAIHDELEHGVGDPTYLMLLGDAPLPGEPADGLIPALPCENDYGDCYTDNAYGDLDGDGIPEVSVGRVPAQSPEEAEAYFARVRHHEAFYLPGLWNRRLSIYSGVGGFGPEIDGMLEYMVLEGAKEVDHGFDMVGAYAASTSDYYYTPFEDKVIEMLNQGNLMTIYIGHGSTGWTEGLPIERIDEIDPEGRAPLSFFFACYNGNYLGAEPSIAESVLFLETGALTSFGSTDVSHPYGNGVLPYEIQRAVFNDRPERLGSALVTAKRQAIENDDELRELMETFAVVGGEEESRLQPLAYQHLDLYNLLGDPAVQIQFPRSEIEFDPGLTGSMGEGQVAVAGRAPGLTDGVAWVTLECERDMILDELEEVDPNNPDPAVVQANWAKAVDKVVVGEGVALVDGAFEASFTLPDDLPPGEYFLKVYAQDDLTDSFGYVPVP